MINYVIPLVGVKAEGVQENSNTYKSTQKNQATLNSSLVLILVARGRFELSTHWV